MWAGWGPFLGTYSYICAYGSGVYVVEGDMWGRSICGEGQGICGGGEYVVKVDMRRRGIFCEGGYVVEGYMWRRGICG